MKKNKPSGNKKAEPQKMISAKPIFDELGIGPEQAQKYMRGFLNEMEKMKDEIEREEILKKDKLTPEEIWSMKPTTFYAWRVKYDLPRILDHFAQKLNRFVEWKENFELSDDALMRYGISNCVNLKDARDDDKQKYIFYKEGENSNGDFLSDIDLSNKISTMWGKEERFVLKKKFMSYLDWCELTRIKAFGTRSNEEVFSYTSASGIRSTAIKISILDNFEMLKVGGITIQPNAVGLINPKYFEFVNASYLTIQGHINSAGLVLRFENSIVDDLTCENLEYPLVEFSNCSLANLRIKDSNIAQWNFYRTNISGKISDSSLGMIRIIGGRFNAVLNNTHIHDVHADHMGKQGFTSTYQILKKTYADQGDDRNAIIYFLKEKRRDRLSLFDAISTQQIRSSFKISAFKEKFYLLLNIAYVTARYLFSLLNDLYWGYGRRPFNIVGWSLLMILVCGITFFYNQSSMNMPNLQAEMSFADSLYYSTITFTTLGYGDFTPKDFLRVVASIEALFGGMSIGFLVAGFANLKY
ncbi:hypothetical protein QF042_003763 [Pedobacter sp. W3I1]|uniref:potassium channel family protein n=1 Tax=Pedobacter sp. W3I1 TaxID=3042291 RepID=UPI00277E8E38|nr:potassium channel family protein [Pedobacter sp. W3I1]MDQ0640198.1 hypothetical protein [Pedobacter sp. W3I1]